MPLPDHDQVQELLSRISGLNFALENCLTVLSSFYGEKASVEVKALRDTLIDEFHQSGIPPENAIEHAQIVAPAVDAIKIAFDPFIS